MGAGADRLRGAQVPADAQVRRVSSATELAGAPGPWDVVCVAGVLERERWDRWFVQRVHRSMATGGRLVLEVPNLLDVWSPAGLAYLASRVERQVRRRVAPRTAIPQADRSAFAGRRYLPAALAAMVSSVGFEIEAAEMIGAPPLGGLGRRTARAIRITARRQPSLWGPERPFPDRGAVLAGYASRHAETLSRRDARRRALGSGGAVQPVDIQDWVRRGALVFSPHPDDEVIGCGGTLLDVAARGGTVTVVQVTDGSDSAAFIDEPESVRRQVRLDEAAGVARHLGARELVCLRADNRALRATPELRAAFRDALEKARAGVVFAPSFTDIHPDHQTVLRLLADALREMPGERPDVALYEVWSLVSPTHVHPVDGRIQEIEALLLDYWTALKIDDYVHLVAERLLYNACEYGGGPGYLECFEVHAPSRFL